MTIDEAIEMYKKIAKEKANEEKLRKIIETGYDGEISIEALFCDDTSAIKEAYERFENCAEEHEQLAEWLEELKNYRDKNKMVVRIDCANSEEFNDIAVKLAKEQYNKAIDDIKEKLMKNGFIYTQHALDVFNEIAEQLKKGGKQTDDN